MSDPRVHNKRKSAMLQRRRRHVHKSLGHSHDKPRLVVYRSLKHIYAQLVDPVSGRTIAGCSTLTPELKPGVASSGSRVEQAKLVGAHLAVKAKDKGIIRVAFDRNGRKYHGRVKALAEGAREGGLEF